LEEAEQSAKVSVEELGIVLRTYYDLLARRSLPAD